MEKRIKIVSVWIVILGFAFWYAHIAKAVPIYDTAVDTSEYVSVNRESAEILQQEFVCSEKKLDGISVKAKILEEINEGEIKYSLKDSESGDTLREGIADATKIKSTKFFLLPFDTLDNCKGKGYTLQIEFGSKETERAVGLYYTPEGNGLVINGNATEGVLVMKTVTNCFDIETFVILLCFVAFIFGFLKFLYKLFK